MVILEFKNRKMSDSLALEKALIKVLTRCSELLRIDFVGSELNPAPVLIHNTLLQFMGGILHQ